MRIGPLSRAVTIVNYVFTLVAVGLTYFWGKTLMTLSAFRGVDFFILLAVVLPTGLLFAVLPGAILWWRHRAPALRNAVCAGLFATAILLAEAVSLCFVPLRVD